MIRRFLRATVEFLAVGAILLAGIYGLPLAYYAMTGAPG